MSNRTQIAVTATAEAALRRLKKGEIAVFDCKKRGADFIFCIKDKDVKKVFAIFAKPCYNVRIEKLGRKAGLLKRLALRAGLLAGAAVFAASAVISNLFCLKIEVVGSGAYLEEAVRAIVYEMGAGEGKPFSAADKSVVAGRVLALPNVVFCNMSKRGSVMVVDVEVSYSPGGGLSRDALISDVDGKVIRITAICGTAAVAAGDEVKKGQKLILPNEVSEGGSRSCLAVGYAELECRGSATYLAPDGGEESIRLAYASLLAGQDEFLSRSHTVKNTGDGALIIMEFTFLHKLSVNIK